MVDSASHTLWHRSPQDDEATRINTASSGVFSMALRACERAPENPAAWGLLEDLARARTQVERVFALYRDVLASDLPHALLLSLGERAVRFHDQWDEDGEELLAVLTRLLEIDPTLQWAFDRASVQLTMLGRWTDLLGLYDGAIAISETDRRLTLLDEAARVAKDDAGDLDRAVSYLDALFEASGRGLRVASSIDRLLAQQGRYADRIRLWERRIAVADPAEGAALRLRVTRHYLEDLDDAERALEASEAIDGNPATARDVDELLEEIATSPATGADTRRRALERLLRHCDASGRRADAIRVLEDALAHARDADAVAMHGEVARRLVEEGHGERAIAHLAAVVAHDPEACDDRTVDGLLEGTFADTLAGCRMRLDAGRARTLVHGAARLAGASEAGRDRAAHLYRALLEHEPGDVSAMNGLAEILRARGAHAELVRLCEHELRFAADRSRRLALRLEIARLQGVLGDPGAGAAALGENLAEDPDDGATIDALGRLCSDLGAHGEAVIWLERSLAKAPAREQGERTIRLARAHLAAGQRDRALAALEHRLRSEPGDLATRTLLLELLRAGDARDALASALVEGATYVEGARRRALLREAADVLIHELGEVDDAVVLLQRLLVDDAGDAAVRADLAEALRRGGRADEARAIAVALVGQFGRRHAPERSAMHLLLARVARAEGDDQEALSQLELAVATDARNVPAQRLLGKLCRKLGQPARAERAFQVLLQLQRRGMGRSARDGAGIAVSETLVELYRVATLLGDTKRAEENLASAFDAARDDEDEAAGLEHALRRARMFELLLRALEQRLVRTVEASKRAVVLAQKSAVEESLGRDSEALESALLALALAPGDVALHEHARSLSARADEPRRYVEALEGLIDAALGSGDGQLGCELLLRLGAVFEHELAQPDEAAVTYERAENTSENLVEVWRAMANLGGKRPDRQPRLAALRKLADSPEVTGEERADVLHTLADLELQTSDTTDAGLVTLELALDTAGCAPRWKQAAASLRRALQVSVDREPVERVFEVVARASGDDGLLLDVLWAASMLPRPDPETVKEAFALADRLGAADRATRLLERAVAAAQDASDPAEALWAMLRLAERSEEAGDLGASLLWMTRAADVADLDESSRLLMRVAELARIVGDGRLLEATLARASSELADPGDRNRMRMELSALLLQQPERCAEACDVLRAALDKDPDHREAAQRLVAWLDPREDAAERASLLERLIAHESGARRFELALELCEARCRIEDAAGLERAIEIARDVDACERAADPIAARPVLEEALGLLPDSLPVLALRASVRSACGEHEAAVADLEHALAIDGDRWLPELQDALEQARRAASETGDLEAERRYVLRQSELLGRSGQTSAARDVLTDLVEGSFYDREITEHVLELDVAAGRWADVVEGCNKLLALECGPELASVALLLADACDKLGCPEEARRGLERAQDQDPANTALRERLRALYERLSAHGPLADLLVLEAGEAPDDDRRFGLLREAGRLRLRRTDAPASAVGPLSEAASLCPTDHEVNLLLADALLATGLVDEAARLLEDAIGRHAGKRSHDLASLQHRMSRVVAARAPGKQLPWLVAAFGGHPKDVDIASDLAEVATAQQQYDIALQAWRAVIAASEGSPVVRATAYARQARIAQLQGDVPRALVLARRAKSEHPELAEAASLLRDLGARS